MGSGTQTQILVPCKTSPLPTDPSFLTHSNIRLTSPALYSAPLMTWVYKLVVLSLVFRDHRHNTQNIVLPGHVLDHLPSPLLALLDFSAPPVCPHELLRWHRVVQVGK